MAAVRALADAGAALLLVEHDLELVRTVATRVAVLVAGRLIADAAPKDALQAMP
jgi:ABC-type branched-subunit amino acid transport system ATPase component